MPAAGYGYAYVPMPIDGYSYGYAYSNYRPTDGGVPMFRGGGFAVTIYGYVLPGTYVPRPVPMFPGL